MQPGDNQEHLKVPNQGGDPGERRVVDPRLDHRCF